jgi:hypothetical protein
LELEGQKVVVRCVLTNTQHCMTKDMQGMQTCDAEVPLPCNRTQSWSAEGVDIRLADAGELRSVQGFAPVVPEEMELVYIVWDVIYLNGESIAALPLRERHARLREVMRQAPATGVEIEGGQTPMTARLVPLVPGATEPLLPGSDASMRWSVEGVSAADVQVRCT